jgi:hypothetical protein
MELDAENNNQLEYLMTIWRLNDLINETKNKYFCLLNSQDSG